MVNYEILHCQVTLFVMHADWTWLSTEDEERGRKSQCFLGITLSRG